MPDSNVARDADWQPRRLRRGPLAITITLFLGGCSCTRTAEPSSASTRQTRTQIAASNRAANDNATPTYVGSQICASCHPNQFVQWRGSHHDDAMQDPSASSIKGQFDGRELVLASTRTRFVREDAKYIVEMQSGQGPVERFEVVASFGVEPLQQYLVEVQPGRRQALSVAWDDRPESAGGQRWFDLQTDSSAMPGDPTHWSGPGYNWNRSCAACHSTHVDKNYSFDDDRYATSYAEQHVGCEACHGPASLHVQATRSGTHAALATWPGPAQRVWRRRPGAPIATLDPSTPPSNVSESCAPCHARRVDLGGSPSSTFHDRYRLSLLDDGAYYADGQIRDEVFTYGSFAQSRMFAAGVVCTDCHAPHGLELRAPGDALCERCHDPDHFSVTTHHGHVPGSPGSHCIDCHMPRRTYMGIDDRRDHRFGIPQPQLGVEHGLPNACNAPACHAQTGARWASEILATRAQLRPVAPVVQALIAARENHVDAASRLVAVLGTANASAIARATAVVELGPHLADQHRALLATLARDPDPLVRRAVATLGMQLPGSARASILLHLLDDPVRSVRLEAMPTLLALDPGAWTAAQRRRFSAVLEDYRQSLLANADHAGSAVDLARLELAQGQGELAQRRLEAILDRAPWHTPAHVNLADVLRTHGDEERARSVLERALPVADNPAAVQYALGLALVRAGRHEQGLEQLRAAHAAEPKNLGYGYAHALALFAQGQQTDAVQVLESLQSHYPTSERIRGALVDFRRQLRETPRP